MRRKKDTIENQIDMFYDSARLSLVNTYNGMLFGCIFPIGPNVRSSNPDKS